MKLPFGGDICSTRILFSLELPRIFTFPTNTNFCAPFTIPARHHSQYSSRAILTGGTHILLITTLCGGAEIFKSIVRSLAILVI